MKMEELLNRAGEEGWECVGTVSRVTRSGPSLATEETLMVFGKLGAEGVSVPGKC